jgi:hypothetical protein
MVTEILPSESVSSPDLTPSANAPNVLQPYWLIVLPLEVPALTSLVRDPSGKSWNYMGEKQPMHFA